MFKKFKMAIKIYNEKENKIRKLENNRIQLRVIATKWLPCRSIHDQLLSLLLPFCFLGDVLPPFTSREDITSANILFTSLRMTCRV